MVLGFVTAAVGLATQAGAFAENRRAGRAQRALETERRRRAIRNEFRQKRIAYSQSTLAALNTGVSDSSLSRSAQESIEAQSTSNLDYIRRTSGLADTVASARDRATTYQNIGSFVSSASRLYQTQLAGNLQQSQSNLQSFNASNFRSDDLTGARADAYFNEPVNRFNAARDRYLNFYRGF